MASPTEQKAERSPILNVATGDGRRGRRMNAGLDIRVPRSGETMTLGELDLRFPEARIGMLGNNTAHHVAKTRDAARVPTTVLMTGRQSSPRQNPVTPSETRATNIIWRVITIAGMAFVVVVIGALVVFL